MEGGGRQCVHQSVGAKEHVFMREIVEEHRDHGIGAQFGFRRGSGDDRAFARQTFRSTLGSVPHRQFMSGADQSQRHRRSHLSQS